MALLTKQAGYGANSAAAKEELAATAANRNRRDRTGVSTDTGVPTDGLMRRAGPNRSGAPMGNTTAAAQGNVVQAQPNPASASNLQRPQAASPVAVPKTSDIPRTQGPSATQQPRTAWDQSRPRVAQNLNMDVEPGPITDALGVDAVAQGQSPDMPTDPQVIQEMMTRGSPEEQAKAKATWQRRQQIFHQFLAAMKINAMRGQAAPPPPQQLGAPQR